MEAMGIKLEELRPEVQVGGVATYLADAVKSRFSFFI